MSVAWELMRGVGVGGGNGKPGGWAYPKLGFNSSGCPLEYPGLQVLVNLVRSKWVRLQRVVCFHPCFQPGISSGPRFQIREVRPETLGNSEALETVSVQGGTTRDALAVHRLWKGHRLIDWTSSAGDPPYPTTWHLF